MSQSRVRPAIKRRHWAERLLLVAGLIAIGISAASYLSTAVFQSWQNFVFECRLRSVTPTVADYVTDRVKRVVAAEQAWCGVRCEPTTLPAPRAARTRPPRLSIPHDGLVGRLVIPRLKLGEIVREGAGERTLSLALGHIPGTALPGERGNVGVAGHRDTLFRSLRSIGKDDRIQFQTLRGSYDYRVESIQIVKPDDVAVLAPGPYPELTLVTCYPFYFVGAAPDRFIVKARQISPEVPAVTASRLRQPNPPQNAGVTY
jgi:sortase A